MEWRNDGIMEFLPDKSCLFLEANVNLIWAGSVFALEQFKPEIDITMCQGDILDYQFPGRTVNRLDEFFSIHDANDLRTRTLLG